MNRKSFIFAMVALILPTIAIMAQDDNDEMYFGRKSKNDKTVQSDKKQQTRRVVVEYEDDVTQPSNGEADYHTGTLRDVDEYNRRGRRTSVADTNTAVADTVVVTRKKQGSLYDLGYDDGYTRGYRDAEEDEFYYSTRLARFRGIRYYDPWYWDRIAYIYDPWYYDPWFWDPWYRPVYVGGWCSVGWGCTWGIGWSYAWHPGIHVHHHHYYGTGYRTMSVRNANAIYNNRYSGGRTMGMRSATTGNPRTYTDNSRTYSRGNNNRYGSGGRYNDSGRSNTYSGRPSRSSGSNNSTWGGSRSSSGSSSHSYGSPSRSYSSGGGGFRSSGGGGFHSSGGGFGGGGGFRGGRGR